MRETGEYTGDTFAMVARAHIPLFVTFILFLAHDDAVEILPGSEEALAGTDDDTAFSRTDPFPSGKECPGGEFAVEGSDIFMSEAFLETGFQAWNDSNLRDEKKHLLLLFDTLFDDEQEFTFWIGGQGCIEVYWAILFAVSECL